MPDYKHNPFYSGIKFGWLFAAAVVIFGFVCYFIELVFGVDILLIFTNGIEKLSQFVLN